MPPEPKLAALASLSHTLFVVRLTLCCNLSILTKNRKLPIIFSLSLTYFQVYGTSKSSLTPFIIKTSCPTNHTSSSEARSSLSPYSSPFRLSVTAALDYFPYQPTGVGPRPLVPRYHIPSPFSIHLSSDHDGISGPRAEYYKCQGVGRRRIMTAGRISKKNKKTTKFVRVYKYN